METFFWGRTRGSFLELGALDGELFSKTLGVFERILAWRGILIDASPQSFEILTNKRPNQISVHAAICGEARDVHWADSTVSRLDYAHTLTHTPTHTHTHTTAGEYPRPHHCNVCATDEYKDKLKNKQTNKETKRKKPTEFCCLMDLDDIWHCRVQAPRAHGSIPHEAHRHTTYLGAAT